MFVSTAVKYLSLTWQVKKLSLLSAMEYRISFIIQVVGMILNDFGLMVLWFIFFKSFPSLNGWQFSDTLLLFSVGTTAFGLLFVIFGGVGDLSDQIVSGEFDSYLTLPKNILWQVSVNRSTISAIGDLALGVVLFLFITDFSAAHFGLFALLTIIVALIMYNFMVIVQSMAFYFKNFSEAADALFDSLLAFTLYPQSIFHGVLKIIMFTLIPGFFIAALPVQLLKVFSWQGLGALAAFWLLSFIIALVIFKRGLRRYESGNLINVKM